MRRTRRSVSSTICWHGRTRSNRSCRQAAQLLRVAASAPRAALALSAADSSASGGVTPNVSSMGRRRSRTSGGSSSGQRSLEILAATSRTFSLLTLPNRIGYHAVMTNDLRVWISRPCQRLSQSTPAPPGCSSVPGLAVPTATAERPPRRHRQSWGEDSAHRRRHQQRRVHDTTRPAESGCDRPPPLCTRISDEQSEELAGVVVHRHDADGVRFQSGRGRPMDQLYLSSKPRPAPADRTVSVTAGRS